MNRLKRLLHVLLVGFLALAAQPGLAELPGCPWAATVIEGTPELNDDGLSPAFRAWLAANGYADFDFARDDLEGGSYGGRTTADQAIKNQPVVFVHGNSDRAAGLGEGGPVGWTAVLRQFLAAGYTPAELYATTWGPADPAQARDQRHSPEYVKRVRAFLEAVLAYTGAERLDVIAHSMGVTLARRAILGGRYEGVDLGPPLTDRIDTFVGIAGANRGLTACFFNLGAPTCSTDDGFFPGYVSFFGLSGVSDLLTELNAEPGYEADHVYSIWSQADTLIGFGGVVYGRYTSRIPGQDGEKVYGSYAYDHFCVRDLSADVQLEMIREHRVGALIPVDPGPELSFIKTRQPAARQPSRSDMALTLTSSAFGHGEPIPAKYTCQGEDISPPLAWSGAPDGTRSLVLIVDDPDAPDPAAPRTVWVHWVVFNLPSDATGLAEGTTASTLPLGAHEGLNDWKRLGYGGPCPPIGRHRYFHKLYALDTTLSGLNRPTKAQVETAMRGHVLAEAELIGTYKK